MSKQTPLIVTLIFVMRNCFIPARFGNLHTHMYVLLIQHTLKHDNPLRACILQSFLLQLFLKGTAILMLQKTVFSSTLMMLPKKGNSILGQVRP